MTISVIVPTLGESVSEATVGRWLKMPGEAIAADEAIVGLETDKVAVEVPASVGGVVSEHVVQEGDTVKVGAVLARIEPSDPRAGALGQVSSSDTLDQAELSAADPYIAPHPERVAEPIPPTPAFHHALASDIVALSGRGGGKERRAGKGASAAAENTGKMAGPSSPSPSLGLPAAQQADGRSEMRVRMTHLRQAIALRVKEAQETAAILTTINDVDMTAVLDARDRFQVAFEKKQGVKLGLMGFFVKAVCMALRDAPLLNASIDGDEVVHRGYYDISIAVSTPDGSAMPVIRDAQNLSVAGIERMIGEFSTRAVEGKLMLEELRGGTFAISNSSPLGALVSTPIISPPQSAGLNLHRVEERPVVRSGQIVSRPMMYAALSYDHRLIDGRDAILFLGAIKHAIENPAWLLLDC